MQKHLVVNLVLAGLLTAASHAAPGVVGKWSVPGHKGVLTIKANNTYTVDMSGTGKPDVLGKVKITGHTIVFTDISGPAACKKGSGTYTFTITGNELKFSAKSDPCDERKGGLSQPWDRK